MDAETLQFTMLMNEEMIELEEEEEDLQMLASSVVILGAEMARQDRIESRQPSRLYLRRSELLPNPRLNTPWQALYDSQNDRAFITTTGFDVATFGCLLTAGFAQKWYTIPISRADINNNGDARPGRRSLDAAGALGLVLHYLNSTMRETSLQQIFAIIPATVTRYITFGLHILLTTLKDISEAKIQWLRGADFERCSALVVTRHPRLTGAFGSIDGLKLPVQTSDDIDIENATFNGWLSEHFISSVLAFSAEGWFHLISTILILLTSRLHFLACRCNHCCTHQCPWKLA
jgi:hypothetical protein